MNNIKKLMELNKFGIKLGLENMDKLCQHFDNPQNKLQIIHIAGTNGKGSTTAMTAKLLALSEFKVATYTSPFVNTINENFQINGEMISDAKLEEFAKIVLTACDEQKIPATHYEVCTMMMFLYAFSEQVDYLILEVGLGGRYDATNIVKPLVSIITNVSLDHTNILGTTIEQIAQEKVGIIKPDVPVIIGQKNPQLNVILNNFSNKIIYAEEQINKIELDYKRLVTIVELENERYELALFGEHQAYNFAIVYQLSKYLNIKSAIVAKMTKEVAWKYRFEVFQQSPLIILDGAHNIASLKALKTALAVYSPDDIQLIFSALKDKEIEKMAIDLASISNNLIITSLNQTDKERGLSAHEIADRLKIPATIIEDNNEAFVHIYQNPSKVNVICGSFQLLHSFEKITKSYKM